MRNLKLLLVLAFLGAGCQGSSEQVDPDFRKRQALAEKLRTQYDNETEEQKAARISKFNEEIKNNRTEDRSKIEALYEGTNNSKRMEQREKDLGYAMAVCNHAIKFSNSGNNPPWIPVPSVVSVRGVNFYCMGAEDNAGVFDYRAWYCRQSESRMRCMASARDEGVPVYSYNLKSSIVAMQTGGFTYTFSVVPPRLCPTRFSRKDAEQNLQCLNAWPVRYAQQP